MKTTQLASLSVALVVFAANAHAQGKACTASVTKHSVTQNTLKKEKAWDLVFDISVAKCDSSRGQFDFMVEVGGSKSTELIPRTADFTTDRGQATTLKITYHPQAGQEVKNVSGIVVKDCTCPLK